MRARAFLAVTVERDPKTPASLIALARTRRMQRALAHAFLQPHAPTPTLESSLGYMTTTARVADDAAGPGHRMSLLGLSWFEGIAYIVEELGGGDAPIVYRLYLRGPRQGHLVPLHAWYDHSHSVRDIRIRIAALAPTLEPALPTAAEAWMLSTRIIQRRALRVSRPGVYSDLPIRKFALQLVIEPVSGDGASGRSTVTAFLSPHAQLAEAWAIPVAPTGPTCMTGRDGAPRLAIARVTFTGIPSGTGLSKDTVVLLTAGSAGADDVDSHP
jgi:hypothetical protein